MYVVFTPKLWISIKLDIHCQTAPRKWRGSPPQHSNSPPFHLGGSFTEAPCKSHYWSLRSPRAIAPTFPPDFKTEPLAKPSRESFTLPPPRVYILWFSLL
ncbi:hypothetical protein AVEN_226298-1 [Araneus ventricosus]|uniref:Uncharacterized protein n=1 Tax=Araneus ventricosus TaxID=182803 RepID=A0A4Y2DB30_ARAVE|nr:hypothetical protein AVEN_226298-1 [Araneus ventricosus]